MDTGKNKIIRNRTQCNSAPPEPSFHTTASPGYPNMPENESQNNDIKSHLMEMIEVFKEDINNIFKELQEKAGKQVEALREETRKFSKEIQENRIKQVKEWNIKQSNK